MSDTYTQAPETEYGHDGEQGNGLAIASLVLGLVSVVLMCIWYIALPCGILAIIFGVIGRGNAKRGAKHGGMATAGLILGVFGLALPILLLLGCLAVLGLGGPEVMEELREAAEQAQQSAGP